MRCPFCYVDDTRVIDSRPADDGCSIRRRRQCDACGRRFTTYEKVETIPLIVIKKDKNRETYDRKKIESGIIRSCHKRPVSAEQISKCIDDIENEIFNLEAKEVESTTIGEIVMDKIKDLDQVAYVRFASVYREFKDVNTFMNELSKLLSANSDKIVEKKSRFIGYAQPVSSEEEAYAFVESVKKKHYDARHNCHAFAIGKENTLYRFSDDGEPQGTAGKPILEVISGNQVTDICIVVTRYFGGTLLGTGGLVRAYTEAAKLALADAGIHQMQRMKLMDITCSYNDSGKVQYLLSTNEISIENTEYGADVTFHTAVPVSDVSMIKKKITEATAARAVIDEKGEKFV